MPMRMRAVAVLITMVAGSAVVASPMLGAERCAGPDDPLYGVVRVDGSRMLARLDSRTLRPAAGVRVRLPAGAAGWNWEFSPDCRAIALAANSGGRILLVDLEGGQSIGTVGVGGRAAVGTLAWPQPERLIAFAAPYAVARLVTIDLRSRRVASAGSAGGEPVALEPTALGMVAVVAARAGRGSDADPVSARG